MVLNYIAAGLAGLFFILCILSLITEASPSKAAAPRNFFRRIKTSLREIDLLIFLIIAAIVIVIALKTDKLDIVWAGCSLGAAALGLILLDSFRIFGRSRSLRRKKKRSPLNWVSDTREAKETPEAKEPKELSEAVILSENAELQKG